MNTPEKGARMTISALAARRFFDPEVTKGLKVRTLDDTITLRPTDSKSGSDVVAVEFRKRGGMMALIDEQGTHSTELLRLFRKAGFRSARPFFVLNERPRGWVGIEHYTGDNPPITKPHLRLWMADAPTRGRKAAQPQVDRRKSPERRTDTYQRNERREEIRNRQAQRRADRVVDTEPERRRAADDDTVDWRLVRKTLVDAKALLSVRGRPSRETAGAREQARRILEQFEKLVETVVPKGAGTGQSTALREARDERDKALSERDALRAEIEALQLDMDRERRQHDVDGEVDVKAPAQTPIEDVEPIKPTEEPVDFEDIPVEQPTDPAPRKRRQPRRRAQRRFIDPGETGEPEDLPPPSAAAPTSEADDPEAEVTTEDEPTESVTETRSHTEDTELSDTAEVAAKEPAGTEEEQDTEETEESDAATDAEETETSEDEAEDEAEDEPDVKNGDDDAQDPDDDGDFDPDEQDDDQTENEQPPTEGIRFPPRDDH